MARPKPDSLRNHQHHVIALTRAWIGTADITDLYAEARARGIPERDDWNYTAIAGVQLLTLVAGLVGKETGQTIGEVVDILETLLYRIELDLPALPADPSGS